MRKFVVTSVALCAAVLTTQAIAQAPPAPAPAPPPAYGATINLEQANKAAALTLDGIIASEGGIPLVMGGSIVGAMGCSGGTGQQDGQPCQAAVDAMK